MTTVLREKRNSVNGMSGFILAVLLTGISLVGCTEEKKTAVPLPPPEVEVAEVSPFLPPPAGKIQRCGHLKIPFPHCPA